MKALTSWCHDNNLSLNVSKTKEMIVEYRGQEAETHWPIYISSAEVDRISISKFLCVRGPLLDNTHRHCGQSLPATLLPKEAKEVCHEWQHHLRLLYNQEFADALYYGMRSQKSQERGVEKARHIIGKSLPAIQKIYLQWCLRKGHSTMKDHSHPAHQLFSLLPSGKLAAQTTGLKNSFYHRAIRFLNSNT